MNRFAQARIAFDYTVEQMADSLSVSIDEVNRWEADSNLIERTTLQNMALLFNTSIDDLRGTNPFETQISTNSFFVDNSEINAFWGHVGIEFQDEKEAVWYPISQRVEKGLKAAIKIATRSHSWVAFQTLNNGFILLNLVNIQSVMFSNKRHPEMKINLPDTWDIQGYPLDIYRALSALYTKPYAYQWDSNYSDGFIEAVKRILNQENIHPSHFEGLCNTRIDYINSKVCDGYRITAEALYTLYQTIESGAVPFMYNLYDQDKGVDQFVLLNQIAMIQGPLFEVVDYINSTEELSESPK